MILRLALISSLLTLCAASPWSDSFGSRFRVLAGARDGAIHWAGLEIALDAGWKTYWRMPGDSGIPPRIDSSASINLGALDVLWPTPMRFKDGAGTSIGYSSSTILPLRITPADPARPVILDVSIQYGACKEVCVPAEGRGRAILYAAGPDAVAILASKARVPQESDGLVQEGGFGVTSARVAGETLEMEVSAPGAPMESIDAFVEGPEGTVLSPPERIGGARGRAKFRLKLGELTADQRSAFSFTTVAPGRALTQRWRP